MIFLLGVFTLSLCGIAVLFGIKIYTLKTNKRPLPRSLRRRIKNTVMYVENRVELWLRYINRKTFELILRQLGRIIQYVLKVMIRYLRRMYDRAARTQRRLRGQNNSSGFLHEVIAHKNGNEKDTEETVNQDSTKDVTPPSDKQTARNTSRIKDNR
jgi:hypothetical protein